MQNLALFLLGILNGILFQDLIVEPSVQTLVSLRIDFFGTKNLRIILVEPSSDEETTLERMRAIRGGYFQNFILSLIFLIL